MRTALLLIIIACYITSMLAFSSFGFQRSKLMFRPATRLALFNDGTRRNEFQGRSNNRFSSSGRGRSVDNRPPREDSFRNDRPSNFQPRRFNDRPHYDDNRYSHNNRQYDRYHKEEKSEPAWGYYDGDHLFGISPVSLALSSNRRKIKELLVQEGMDLSNKKDKKAAANILKTAKEKSIPIREFSKHDLNMITDNKLHQGFVLRAEPLEFESLTQLEPSSKFSCVLALDEVWDPMNFGALVRTSYFLGVDKIVICAKNSAPLSPTVSKASAGAVELVTIYSTKNMMSFLDKSVANGWQVVGTDLGPKSTPLTEFIVNDKPTILVLGNEGHGIRTNILRRCTSLVRISKPTISSVISESVDSEATAESESVAESAASDEDSSSNSGRNSGSGGGVEVDSLNVSVTGGIILHHLLKNRH